MGRGGKGSKINWLEIEREYVQGFTQADGDPLKPFLPTLKELSELHGISFDAIQYQCKTYGWSDKRADYQREIADKLRQITKEKYLSRIETFFMQTIENAMKANERAGEVLDKPTDEIKEGATAHAGGSVTIFKQRRGSSAHDFKRATETVLNAQTIVIVAKDQLGIEQPDSFGSLAEKLEQARAEAAKLEEAQPSPDEAEPEDEGGEEPDLDETEDGGACPYVDQ